MKFILILVLIAFLQAVTAEFNVCTLMRNVCNDAAKRDREKRDLCETNYWKCKAIGKPVLLD